MPRGRQPANPSAEPTAPFPTDGIDHLKLDDPEAMVITTANGPKTSPGSKLHWVQGDGPRVIVHQHLDGRFQIYDRRKIAPAKAEDAAKVAAD